MRSVLKKLTVFALSMVIVWVGVAPVATAGGKVNCHKYPYSCACRPPPCHG